MDFSPVSLPVSNVVPIPVSTRHLVAVFPHYGYENTQFRLVVGQDIDQLCFEHESFESGWTSPDHAASIRLNTRSLSPGHHSLRVKWRGKGQRGEDWVQFHVLPGRLLGEGLPVDFGFDAERFFLARQTGVEIWHRSRNAFIGKVLLPSLDSITAVAVQPALHLLAIGTTNGLLYLCDLKTGRLSCPFASGTAPVTTLFFSGSVLTAVCGMRNVHIFKAAGLHQLSHHRSVEFKSDVHSISNVSGELWFATFNSDDLNGRCPLIRLGENFMLLCLSESFMTIRDGDVKKYSLNQRLGWCDRILHVSSKQGRHELLSLSGTQLSRLTYVEDRESISVVPLASFRNSMVSRYARIVSSGEVWSCSGNGMWRYPATPWGSVQPATAVPLPEDQFGAISVTAVSEALSLAVMGDIHGRIALVDLGRKTSSIQTIHQDADSRIVTGADQFQEGRHSNVTALKFIPGTPFFLSGGLDAVLALHEVIGSVFITRWKEPSLEGSVQDISPLPDSRLLAVTQAYSLSLWHWDENAPECIASWNSGNTILDPLCISPGGDSIVVGDWRGNVHVFESVRKNGLVPALSMNVSEDSLLSLCFIGRDHIFAVTEGNACVLIDVTKRQICGAAPFFRIFPGNRRSTDLAVEVGGEQYLAVSRMPSSTTGMILPLHLIPAKEICWTDGQLFFTKRDLMLASKDALEVDAARERG